MIGVQPERTSSEPPDWDDHWEAYGAIATVKMFHDDAAAAGFSL